jgi:hypothetical protein
MKLWFEGWNVNVAALTAGSSTGWLGWINGLAAKARRADSAANDF